MKQKYPTKEEVVQTLLREDPSIKNHNRLILLIEFKKVTTNIGIVGAELLSNGKVIVKGSYTCVPVTTEESSFDWNILKKQESYAQGYSLDFKGETIRSRLLSGFNNAIQEGRIPFMLK
jgi:hypothetical protein